MEADFERRFGGIGRLYGTAAQERFREAHVCVVGIGGVGSWAAEALARSGIGAITLVDLDNVAESNTNRQIHALEDTFGMAKVTAMAARIRAINPDCRIVEIENFVTPDNAAAMFAPGFDCVIDAIDQVKAKVAMIACCHAAKLPIIVAGGAGGKIDPTCLRLDDLSRTVQDPLLARVRSLLRKEHGFSRDAKRKFGVTAVYSTEAVRQPQANQECEVRTPSGGLNCAGFGSSMCITASFGLFAVSAALRLLMESK
ncbi:MAG: tRNA threonylcarbamoyladenosine dehydratase [Pseudomonadota bacterium]|nr:tRNA threonylcarbamoyladenosine dehydratase [Pseudomonadota bacterium]MDQ5882271.1 tRNA threonylcarbamoyladenosine dehydratase [Pseudomonadota bacterium]MDQ5916137.1 tRNA threonylcarbamoyladenosine dehydratase [Pseudomonadota bacterium]MDQ5917389.1 tRNA threonylcarbamoyladenosine dehydratase [Pseudomonadota bacterium]MDQ5943036.1 tRNA threonylcarbamoyladenosine dehydratase [Pseudomonadota bacterium]